MLPPVDFLIGDTRSPGAGHEVKILFRVRFDVVEFEIKSIITAMAVVAKL